MKKRTGMIAAVALTLTTAAPAQNTTKPIAGKINLSDQQRGKSAAFWTNDMLENATPMPLPRVDPASLPHNDSYLQHYKGTANIEAWRSPELHSTQRGPAQLRADTAEKHGRGFS